KFEVHAEEGMELLEEFYPHSDSAVDTEHSAQLSYVQEIQQGLQQSVRPVN
ncbi:hydrolase or metal-binding protein, partial [Acinetobacter baumannii]